MDIVQLVIERNRGDAKGRKSDGLHVVYWMHFENSCPQPVASLIEATRPGEVFPVRTYSPGAFLMELYSELVGAHPLSPHPYSPQVPRPIVQPRITPQTQDKPIRFFVDAPGGYDLGASLELARLAAEKAATLIPIWIDLEAMQTVPEVVADIFRQIRKYDTALPPLAHEDERGTVAEFVRRIYDVLARGRYLLAFNAVGSFGRPPTVHHEYAVPQRAAVAAALADFLHELYVAAHRESDWNGPPLAACKGRLKDSILLRRHRRASSRARPWPCCRMGVLAPRGAESVLATGKEPRATRKNRPAALSLREAKGWRRRAANPGDAPEGRAGPPGRPGNPLALPR